MKKRISEMVSEDCRGRSAFRSCTLSFSCDLCSSFISWTDSGGEEAFNTGLNVTYQEKDGRPIVFLLAFVSENPTLTFAKKALQY